MVRWILKGSLILDGPLHVGTGEWSDECDLPILRDHRGLPLIEGSSLVGVLRAGVEGLAQSLGYDEGDIQTLFGSRDAEKAAASALRVACSHLIGPEWLIKGRDLRDSVGIDRKRGAAHRGALFTWETLPPGSEFFLYAYADIPDNEVGQRYLKLLSLMLDALASGRITIGGKSSVGMGIVKLGDDTTIHTVDFSNTDILKEFISRTTPFWAPASNRGSTLQEFCNSQVPSIVTTSKNGPFPTRCVIHYTVTVKDFLLVRSGYPYPMRIEDWGIPRRSGGAEERFLDAQPVLISIHGEGAPYWEENSSLGEEQRGKMAAWLSRRVYIPGTSVRGVIRSRAERVLRTLPAAKFPGQHERIAACDLFDKTGLYRACSDRVQTLEKMNQPPTVEQLVDQVCLGCRLFGYQYARGRCQFSNLYPEDSGAIRFKFLDHVAIDRFTGGAAEERKFDALVISAGTFRGTITLHRPESWQLALLGHVFKDLYDEDLPLGHATHRGYGRVQGVIQKIIWEGREGEDIAVYFTKLGRRIPDLPDTWPYARWEIDVQYTGEFAKKVQEAITCLDNSLRDTIDGFQLQPWLLHADVLSRGGGD